MAATYLDGTKMNTHTGTRAFVKFEQFQKKKFKRILFGPFPVAFESLPDYHAACYVWSCHFPVISLFFVFVFFFVDYFAFAFAFASFGDHFLPSIHRSTSLISFFLARGFTITGGSLDQDTHLSTHSRSVGRYFNFLSFPLGLGAIELQPYLTYLGT